MDDANQPTPPAAPSPNRGCPQWRDLPPFGSQGWRGLGQELSERLDRSVKKTIRRSYKPWDYLLDHATTAMWLLLVAVVWNQAIFTTWFFAWFFVIWTGVFISASAASAVRQSRRTKRIEAGRKEAARVAGRYPVCLNCDYDVLHCADTCPECGEPVLLVKFDQA